MKIVIDTNVFLSALFSSKGDIITFNPKDFKGVEEKFDILILTPKEFLEKRAVKGSKEHALKLLGNAPQSEPVEWDKI